MASYKQVLDAVEARYLRFCARLRNEHNGAPAARLAEKALPELKEAIGHYHAMHPFAYALFAGVHVFDETGKHLRAVFDGRVWWAGNEVSATLGYSPLNAAYIPLYSRGAVYPSVRAYLNEGENFDKEWLPSLPRWNTHRRVIEGDGGKPASLRGYRGYRTERAFAFPDVFNDFGVMNRFFEDALSRATKEHNLKEYQKFLDELEERGFSVPAEVRALVPDLRPRLLMRPNRYFPNLAIIELGSDALFAVRHIGFIRAGRSLLDGEQLRYLSAFCPRSRPHIPKPLGRRVDCFSYILNHFPNDGHPDVVAGRLYQDTLQQACAVRYYDWINSALAKALSNKYRRATVEALVAYVKAGGSEPSALLAELAYASLTGTL